ncbi:hypothetical protein RFI_10189, partial [Reticulomyxa filosa]
MAAADIQYELYLPLIARCTKVAVRGVVNTDSAEIRLDKTDGRLQMNQRKAKLWGGMQSELGFPESPKVEKGKYEKEKKVLLRLCGDTISEEELQQKLEESNGNIAIVIEQMLAKWINED